MAWGGISAALAAAVCSMTMKLAKPGAEKSAFDDMQEIIAEFSERLLGDEAILATKAKEGMASTAIN